MCAWRSARLFPAGGNLLRLARLLVILQHPVSGWVGASDWVRVIVDLLRYDNFVVCYTESYPQQIT